VSAPRPFTLVAELTHRCPLRCPYCSNPLDLSRAHDELATEAWIQIFRDAEALGVVQLHLTGGEPLARRDLEVLARAARDAGLYVNLITSAVPFDEDRMRALLPFVDHVQISFQHDDEASADAIAGYAAHPSKLQLAALVRSLGVPLTINVVLHRHNIDRVPAMIALAESLGADKLELANAQWHGWAFENRAALLPNEAQIAVAAKAARAARIETLFVLPDHFSQYPRACMDGWARRFIVVQPDGTVLPCHSASSITSLTFERVGARGLAEIWRDSPALNAYRGDSWMEEPCRSCDRRSVDFGGCRCQAFQWTGNAAATDPACHLSPMHALLERREPERTYIHRGSR
jgi:PqqA peptide cyclase